MAIKNKLQYNRPQNQRKKQVMKKEKLYQNFPLSF